MRLVAVPLAAALLLASNVRADSYDLQIWRLGRPDGDNVCAGATPPSGTPVDDSCKRFRMLATELAAMVAPRPSTPADTLGHSGFDFTAELAIAKVQGNGRIGGERYWVVQQTAAGKEAPTTHLIPTLHMRKGLPFSFEIGATVQWITQSNMFNPGIEIKWALNEGFKYIPDLAVRGFGSRLVGNRDLDLTVAGFDLILSKAIGIAGVVNFTPWGGWGMVMFDAATGNLDFDPSHEAGDGSGTYDFVTDDDANFKFGRAIGDNRYHRFFGGVRLIAWVLDVGGYFTYTHINRFDLGIDDKRVGVWTINARLGTDF
jgi:hypothetical protein